MRLKCQHAVGQCVITVDDGSSLQDLLQHIATQVGIPPGRQRLKVGFPPQEVPLGDLTVAISQLGFRSGETVKVEEDANQEGSDPPKPGVAGVAAAELAKVPTPLTATPDPLDPAMFQEGGRVVKRVIQADNSCLFNAIQYVCEGNPSRDGATHLRQLIAQVVSTQPEKYNDAILDKPNKEYCSWVLKPESWGGAIELAILSEYFQTQIRCLDIQTAQSLTFGEDSGYPRCVYTIYDGIHYDAIAFQVCDGAPEEMDITVFSPSDDKVMQGALQLVKELNRARKFTDVGNFTLRCLVCQTGLKGQKEAQEHAKATGHTNFNEY